MEIDLSLLHSKTIKNLEIKDEYDLPKEYYENYESLISIDKINIDGTIQLTEDEKEYFEALITGEMILEDSISLEPTKYPFSIEYADLIEENCKKSENTLDIFQFLWENIVLEIPLNFTQVTDLSKYNGDGWKLISEDELKKETNPFADLLEKFKEE